MKTLYYFKTLVEALQKQRELGINNPNHIAIAEEYGADKIRGMKFDRVVIHIPKDEFLNEIFTYASNYNHIVRPAAIRAEIIYFEPGHQSPLWRVLNGEEV